MGNNAQTCETPIILICIFSCCIDFSFFWLFLLLFLSVIIYFYVAMRCIASWCSFTFFMDVPSCCWSHLHYIDSCFIVLLIHVFSHYSWLLHRVVFVLCIASISIVLLVGAFSFCLWLFNHIDCKFSIMLLVIVPSHC